MGEKSYLGDGVYVAFEGHGAVLTTEDGYRVTNTIVLDDAVLSSLLEWVKRRQAGVRS